MSARVFLALAEGTGRRAGPLRELQRPDIDLVAGRILRRSDNDKVKLQMARPVTRRVIGYLRVWHNTALACRENPIPDMMAAGGWASAEALMRYLKTDEATIARVVNEPTH
jgi:integrase